MTRTTQLKIAIAAVAIPIYAYLWFKTDFFDIIKPYGWDK